MARHVYVTRDWAFSNPFDPRSAIVFIDVWLAEDDGSRFAHACDERYYPEGTYAPMDPRAATTKAVTERGED